MNPSCPFCGRPPLGLKKVYLWKRLWYGHNPVMWAMYCHNCCMAHGPLGETPEEAINKWAERRDAPIQSFAIEPQEIGKNQERLEGAISI